MTFSRGPHQGRLAAERFRGTDFRTVLQQHAHRLDLAGPRSGHQRCLATTQRPVRIRSGPNQELQHRGIAIHASERERWNAVAVLRNGIGTGLEQQLCRLQIVPICRPVQRSHSVDLSCVRIRVAFQEFDQAMAVAPFSCIGQRRSSCRCRKASRVGQQPNNARAGCPVHPAKRHWSTPLPPCQMLNGWSSSSTLPLLSWNESRWIPTLSSSVRCRFDSGVGSA